ncbi:uncharacterized protein LOC143068106 isoform X1 [Mytilus galloprovincialis]|uniref:uncharacterized protein LOC143068106 isoform X1 n=1 Tax=Mytilus galloprovincialis TaxID=29158 RepID=UPI003F7C28D3
MKYYVRSRWLDIKQPMEQCWMMILITGFIHRTLSFCPNATNICKIEYIRVNKYKDLHCPTSGATDLIKWHYRENNNRNWTSFKFKFCRNYPGFTKCKVRDGVLKLNHASGEYEGFYKCTSKHTEHCFELKLYNCDKRKEPLIYEPPKEITVNKNERRMIRCGADFGCDKGIKGTISWEHKGQIINESNHLYQTCFRENVTSIESQLTIQHVIEEDILHPFVCVVKDNQGTNVRRFNVTLIGIDPKLTTCYVTYIILAVIGFVLVAAFILIALFCAGKAFFILTHCSCFSRMSCTGSYSYDVFILYDDGDELRAKKVKDALKSNGYNIATMDIIKPGFDSTKGVKDIMKECASLLVIYPGFNISEAFDHQLTFGKQTIKPYLLSVLVNTKCREHCTTDKDFKSLGLKCFVFDDNFYSRISWRLPKLKKSKKSKKYTETLIS